MFAELIPNNFRAFAGSHCEDAEGARQVDDTHGIQLTPSKIRKHKQINWCFVAKLCLCEVVLASDAQEDADFRVTQNTLVELRVLPQCHLR